MNAPATAALPEPAAERARRVTALELFFDLVFVFAITQVSGFVAHDPTWLGLLEAGAILMALWFAWEGYAWLGNTAGTDGGVMRAVLLAAMLPLLVVCLAVPKAFGADAAVFGVAYLAVRGVHLLAYGVLARADPALRGVVARLAFTTLPAAVVLCVAGFVPEPWRAALWILALAVDYGGLMATGVGGWQVEPAHFAERHGLIVIIALGESIVALGVGASSLGLQTEVLVGAVLGMAVAAALWWAYFDVVATVGERKLREAGADARARIARDSYTYLHLPMASGIVAFAVGVKTTVAHPHAHLTGVTATALCAGVALYLVALSGFKRRNVGSFNGPRLVAAGVLAVLAPVSTHVGALLALGLVAAVSCALVAYEAQRYADARRRIRASG